MISALAASALLMGFAGSPHCAAMCGAACSGIAAGCGGPAPQGRLQALASLHAGRLVSYALAGALVAASASALADWSQQLAWLRPFWAMLHLAALVLGLHLLWTGRQPRWLAALGQGASRGVVAAPGSGSVGGQAMVFRPRRHMARAGLIGLAWAAWPCGLLQSALLVAALASTPSEGAAVMALFAAGSAIGLWLAPWAWLRLNRGGGVVAAAGGVSPRAAIRLAGGLLGGASAWALGHGLWMRYGDLLC